MEHGGSERFREASGADGESVGQTFFRELGLKTCSVNDGQRNCPESPIYEIIRNGKKSPLCDYCYQSYLMGTFGDDPNVIRIEECDLCGNYGSMFNYHEDYGRYCRVICFTGKQFLCNMCL